MSVIHSIHPSNLTVVILAAGLSQRLGFAKQLIVKNHQTLLAEKIQLARQLHPYQVLVVLPKLSFVSRELNVSANTLGILYVGAKNSRLKVS